MKHIKVLHGITIGLMLFEAGLARMRAADEPQFREVYDLVRTNVVGANDADLNQAAVQGFVSQLNSRVILLTNRAESASNTNASSGMRSHVFDGINSYFRLGQIRQGSDKEISDAFEKMSSSNRIKGIILDLRFAEGMDYRAASSVADLFFSSEQQLIDSGQGWIKSTHKDSAIKLPTAILVNQKTAGAAEALAGILRNADIGVIIGSTTAGRAHVFKEFTLETGQHLLLATAPIKVGNDQALTLAGVKPDIQVQVSLEDEQLYLQDPFRELARPIRLSRAASPATNQLSSSTNRSPRRFNEADLVRMLRDGEAFDPESPGKSAGRPVVQDPALARALDLLKGLSVLRQFRTI